MDNPQNFLSHVTSENTWHSTCGNNIYDRFEFLEDITFTKTFLCLLSERYFRAERGR